MFNRASACKSSPKFVSRVLGIVNFSECSWAPAMLNMPPLLTAAFNCYIIWCIIQYNSSLIRLTLGGPKIIPFQYVRLISSSLSNPQLILPSPDPFWPWSIHRHSHNNRHLGVHMELFLTHQDTEISSGHLAHI